MGEHKADWPLDTKAAIAVVKNALESRDQRIAALEADCRDMAEDVLTYAKEQYGDGDGGIHPALHHRWRRDTETARKYRPEALGEVDPNA